MICWRDWPQMGSGHWQCADTLRDVELLRRLWDSGDAPWRVWDDRSANGERRSGRPQRRLDTVARGGPAKACRVIACVLVVPKQQIVDERGKVMHMLRRDDPEFEEFGEIYFSTVNPGVIKGWHVHTLMTLNYYCVQGLAKLDLYDDREGSATRGEVQEVFPGDANSMLVRIPPMIWNGVKGPGQSPAVIANCATLPHDPDEISRIDPFSPQIPYDWSPRHG
jgi:dTDP-4-dehydrorhamnose 3,5-epimerase